LISILLILSRYIVANYIIRSIPELPVYQQIVFNLTIIAVNLSVFLVLFYRVKFPEVVYAAVIIVIVEYVLCVLINFLFCFPSSNITFIEQFIDEIHNL
jgi:hypothetical protein